ncbi:unnamed protein product, partial [Iphiclides podalirius]
MATRWRKSARNYLRGRIEISSQPARRGNGPANSGVRLLFMSSYAPPIASNYGRGAKTLIGPPSTDPAVGTRACAA